MGDGGSGSHARQDRARIASDRRRSDDRCGVKGTVASGIFAAFLPLCRRRPAGIRRVLLIFNPVLAVRFSFLINDFRLTLGELCLRCANRTRTKPRQFEFYAAFYVCVYLTGQHFVDD